MNRRVPRAVIVGGSIGGLFAGLALRKQGWDVQIHESASKLDGRGAGITTHKAVFDNLESLGIANARSIGLQIEPRITLDACGETLGTHRVTQTVTSWGRLHQLLKDAFPTELYHNNSTYSHHEQNLLATDQCKQESDKNTQAVTVHFTDGRRVDATILVAADGIRSSIRQTLNSRVQPDYAGYFAWRGLVDEASLDTPELEALFPYFSFCLPPGEQLLAYPVAGKGSTLVPGKRRLNVVWYRPANQLTGLPELLTDIEGKNNGSSIAPDRIRPAIIEAMRDASRKLLSPQHAALIEKIDQPFIQPIYDVLSDSMVYGRVAVIGDAAFTARPHLGMGVTKAAEDSRVLASCLAAACDENPGSVESALQRFEHQRLSVGKLIVERSRQLGAYLQANIVTETERTNAAQHRSFEAVMRETATDDFLDYYLQTQQSQ